MVGVLVNDERVGGGWWHAVVVALSSGWMRWRVVLIGHDVVRNGNGGEWNVAGRRMWNNRDMVEANKARKYPMATPPTFFSDGFFYFWI